MTAPAAPEIKHTTVRVFRGVDSAAPRFDEYEVPYEEGASVLDALTWIRAHLDSSVAFRYSCVNANACKECMVRVDGKVGYACTERLKDSGVTVEPLKNKRLIRDLVTDIVPPKETLAAARAHGNGPPKG